MTRPQADELTPQDEYLEAMGDEVMSDYMCQIADYNGNVHLPHQRAIACLSQDIGYALEKWLFEHNDKVFVVEDFLNYYFDSYVEPITKPSEYIESPILYEQIRKERLVEILPHLRLQQFFRRTDERFGGSAINGEYFAGASTLHLQNTDEIRNRIFYLGDLSDIENAMHLYTSPTSIEKFGGRRIIAAIAMRHFLYISATGFSYDEFRTLQEYIRLEIEGAKSRSYSGESKISLEFDQLIDEYGRRGLSVETGFVESVFNRGRRLLQFIAMASAAEA